MTKQIKRQFVKFTLITSGIALFIGLGNFLLYTMSLISNSCTAGPLLSGLFLVIILFIFGLTSCITYEKVSSHK